MPVQLRADTDGGMNRGIYATASGMAATDQLMDTVANNLANVSTNGFKRDAVFFNEAMERTLAADGGKGKVIGTLGIGPALVSKQTVFELGPTQSTGNPLDLAIDSEQGAFAVQNAKGQIRYTRDGAFQINGNGQLATARGELVLDDSLSPIDIGKGNVQMQSDGNVMVDGKSVGIVGVFQGTFVKAGPNTFICKNPTLVDAPKLKTGAVEGSNVNAVEAMVEMIRMNRNFELSHRSIVQQDELVQRLIQSLQDR